MFGCNDLKEINNPAATDPPLFSLSIFRIVALCTALSRTARIFPLGLTTGSRYISNESGQQNASALKPVRLFLYRGFSLVTLSRLLRLMTQTPGFSTFLLTSRTLFFSFAFSQCSMYLLFAATSTPDRLAI